MPAHSVNGSVMRALTALSRNAGLVLAGGVSIGLLLPDLAGAMRDLLPWSIAGLLAIAVARIEPAAILARLRRPLLLGWLLFFTLLVCPVIVWAVLKLLGLDGSLLTAVTLMAATPPLFSSPAMALLWGIDAPLSLVIVAVGTLVGPFTLVFVTYLLPIDFPVDPLTLLGRLVALVSACFAIGLVVRRLVGGARIDAAKAPLDVSVLALLVIFAIAVMDGVWARYLEAPALIWAMLGLSFAVSISLQVFGTLVHRTLPGRSLGWPSALSVGYTTGNRAMGLLLAVVPAGSKSDAVLYFAVAQLPIYLLPLVQTPLFRWLRGRGDPARPPSRSG